MAFNRDEVLSDLRDAGGLWPLIDVGSCTLCAQPRKPQYARWPRCRRCNEQIARYRDPIDSLHPITYTTYDWLLGAGLRTFKNQGCAHDSVWALGFGAILSAWLEKHLTRVGSGHPDLITPVPTTAPVVEAALTRAAEEGWWVPEVRPVATIAPGQPRQRARDSRERANVAVGKWQIDADALAGAHEVVILDDMMSSGGSLFSFARALRDHRVSFVDAVVVARNVGHADGEWIQPLLERRVAEGHPWSPRDRKENIIGG